jgi:hypothetical protein
MWRLAAGDALDDRNPAAVHSPGAATRPGRSGRMRRDGFRSGGVALKHRAPAIDANADIGPVLRRARRVTSSDNSAASDRHRPTPGLSAFGRSMRWRQAVRIGHDPRAAPEGRFRLRHRRLPASR